MSRWGYSSRSYQPSNSHTWEVATLDPVEVHDCLETLGQAEGLHVVDGVLVPEASLEPCQPPWSPLPAYVPPALSPETVEALDRADRAWPAQADLEERQRRARKAARTRARNNARIAAEQRRRRAANGLTVETMIRIATDPKPPPVRRVVTRWADAPLFDVTVDRSQAWGHVIDGRACITEPGEPLCVCGVNRLTWTTRVEVT